MEEEHKDVKEQTGKKFFTRLNLTNKNKPKTSVYDVFYCVRIEMDPQSENYFGTWVSSIEKDDIYNKETTNIKISGDDKDNHIRIRLKGLLETLKWIVGNTDMNMYRFITVNMYCNCHFIVNLINEWIPQWTENNFNINDNDERPNKDLLVEISTITTKVNISAQWLSCKSPEMTTISNIVEESLAKLVLSENGCKPDPNI